MLQLRPDAHWQVPVFLTQGTDGTGVEDLAAAVDAHEEARRGRPEVDDGEGRTQEWYEILRDELSLRLERALDDDALATTAAQLRAGETDPYSAALATLADPRALARLLGATGEGDEE